MTNNFYTKPMKAIRKEIKERKRRLQDAEYSAHAYERNARFITPSVIIAAAITLPHFVPSFV